MKHNYLLYILLFLVVLLRGNIISLINNVGRYLFVKNDSLEINILKNKVANLEREYDSLLSFKNNINIKENYIITNYYLNNYSYDKLLINGNSYHINDEVINEHGLIGIINNIYLNYSEVKYIYNTNIPVIINDLEGKISSKDQDNNLIIKEITNYSNINLNDKVYSVYGTYIGKVINIINNDLDDYIIVKPISINKSKYVAVISR